jgi:hypothetical protein
VKRTLYGSGFLVIAVTVIGTAAGDKQPSGDPQPFIHYMPIRDPSRTESGSSAPAGLPPNLPERMGIQRNRGGYGPDSTSAAPSPIIYHGGPTWAGTPNLYYIWYGWSNWNGGPYQDNTASQVLTFLAQNIGGSPYFRSVITYYSQNGNTRTYASNSMNYAGYITDNYSQGYNVANTGNIVSRAITNGLLPKDTDGIYVVLLSADVTYLGLCTKNCGFHTTVNVGGTRIAYAVVGNTARCRSICGDSTSPPSNDVAADGMANTVSHEVAEIVSDPYGNAWFDKSGGENGDKCAWQFGRTYVGNPLNPRGVWNVVLGSGSDLRRYKLQQLWANYGQGYCTIAY